MDKQAPSPLDEDAHALNSMGYEQELSRNIDGFSNFAVSFSLVCVLAGGITAFPNALSAGGPFSATIGWLIGGLFAIVVACSMGQIASAFPTSGGLYHWSSILGGRAWGWTTAWLNLTALIFTTASVDVGVYQIFTGSLLRDLFGIQPIRDSIFHILGISVVPRQQIIVLLILLSQALLNHFGIRIASLLTDFSGYLIFAVTILLTGSMVLFGVTHHFSTIFQFTNNTGRTGGIYPQARSPLVAFLLGLLFPMYTIAGYDASAHTAEETVNARVAVPRAMLHAVLWSVVLGFVMTISLISVAPDLHALVASGPQSWFVLFNQLPIPWWLRVLLVTSLVIVNYLCGLAAITSTSRMVYAFARDRGLPFTTCLKSVSQTYRTPVAAIWFTAFLSFAVTLYSPAFAALSSASVVFLYVSYAMPVGAGLLAEGKTWTSFGPFRLGRLSKPFAVITIAGVLLLIYAGIQPPSDIVLNYAVGLGIVLLLFWFLRERYRFQGPPVRQRFDKGNGDQIMSIQ
jgi:amino acid transporter